MTALVGGELVKMFRCPLTFLPRKTEHGSILFFGIMEVFRGRRMWMTPVQKLLDVLVVDVICSAQRQLGQPCGSVTQE